MFTVFAVLSAIVCAIAVFWPKVDARSRTISAIWAVLLIVSATSDLAESFPVWLKVVVVIVPFAGLGYLVLYTSSKRRKQENLAGAPVGPQKEEASDERFT